MKSIAGVLAVVLFAGADQPEFFGQRDKLPAFGPKIGKSLPYVLPVDVLNSRHGISRTLE